ncbi:MAG: peptidase U32 family protein, partial [Candidatus Izemoplasmatales bacterium]
MKKVELLAPAGNIDALIGAINAGANAVYIGGKRFGARANADNFSLEQIKEAITFAHLRNAKVYVTINTIIFEDELSSFFEYTDELIKFHVDALIVQDYGMLRQLIHRYPETEIHVSTQMNTLNLHQVKFLEDLGVKRIILARETSIEKIQEFRQETSIEFEIFAHGALCVSYSGNCYLSQMNGSRSGNRGECAQPCRLPYEMYKDETLFHKEAYLLSTKDLMTLPHLGELIEAGVCSLKIEGRMRSLEYTVETIKMYRKYIDEYYGGVASSSVESDIYTLAKLFNRDFTKGYSLGEEPYKINYETRPNHQGVLVGKVLSYHYGKTTILLTQSLSVGDGIRIVGKNDIGEQVSKIVLNGE